MSIKHNKNLLSLFDQNNKLLLISVFFFALLSWEVELMRILYNFDVFCQHYFSLFKLVDSLD
jgi:hypothetical protein